MFWVFLFFTLYVTQITIFEDMKIFNTEEMLHSACLYAVFTDREKNLISQY